MHVCVLSDGYPPWERGGAQKIAAQLARGYARRGHRATVVTAVADRRDAGATIADGVEVHRLYSPKPRALLPYLTVYNPFVVPRCRRLLDALAPDVVHAHNCHWLSNGALRAAADGRPVVKTYHDAGTFAYGDFDAFVERVPVGRGRVPADAYAVRTRRQTVEAGQRYNPLRNRSNRRHLRAHVDVGVAVSDELRRGLAANGMPCDRVVRNGVDTDSWTGGDGEAFRRRLGLDDERIVLFGGRTSETKGGRHVARAVARLGDEVDEPVRLVVTGDDDFAAEMRDEMGRQRHRMTTTGWLDPDAYRDAMDAATVVASPSVFLDPFPTVNLEAFAASTPVVTSRFGGGRELVDHGEDGFVVDPRDEAALADALGRLVADGERASTFGDRGRQKVVDDFRLDLFVDEYLELLERAWDESRDSPAIGAASARGHRDVSDR